MKPIAIGDLAAICNLGESWLEIWDGLLKGDSRLTAYKDVDPELAVDINVAAVSSCRRHLDVTRPGVGAACRLAGHALAGLTTRSVDAIYGATNHGETDAVQELTYGLRKGTISSETERLLEAIVNDPMPVWGPELGGFGGVEAKWFYSACSSASHASAFAAMQISRGVVQCVAVVASDSLSSVAAAGFARIAATTSGAVPPMCEGSDGILIGEGAAALVLRSAARNEIAMLGFGMSCDAAHQIHPDPKGLQLERAIRQALVAAETPASGIGAVVAHGTGTAANDAMEASVLERVFGRGAVPVMTVKGLIGHTMGASGLFNTLVAVETLRRGVLPPGGKTGHQSIPSIDLVLGEPRPVRPDSRLLSISSGFGGNHCVSVIGST